jgi:uncharacterized protein (TIGR02453 family)
MFRPYRDVRFSADKSPYKTTIAASIGADCYLQLSARGLMAGRGTWMMESDQLGRYREAVAADGTGSTLARLIAELRSKKIDVGAHGELKTVPRGFPKDHPRADLLRAKGLTVWKEWEAGPWLNRPNAKVRIIEVLRAGAPVSDWLATYVGDSHVEPG